MSDPGASLTFRYPNGDGSPSFGGRTVQAIANKTANWETELHEPIGNGAPDDPLEPDESEADLLVCWQCASEPCMGDWLSTLF